MHAVQAVFSHGRGSDDPGSALLAAGRRDGTPCMRPGGAGQRRGRRRRRQGALLVRVLREGRLLRTGVPPRGAVPTEVLLGRLTEQEQTQGRQPLPARVQRCLLSPVPRAELCHMKQACTGHALVSVSRHVTLTDEVECTGPG